MRPTSHLVLSVAAGAGTWAITQETWAFPITVAAGTLVDADHVPDFWWAHALDRKPIATFVTHGWEWLIALVVIWYWGGFQWWLSGVIAGYGLHLIADASFNRGVFWGYSFIYRALKRFDMERLFPQRTAEYELELLRRELPWALKLVEYWRTRLSNKKRLEP